jgi:hypothetical protein
MPGGARPLTPFGVGHWGSLGGGQFRTEEHARCDISAIDERTSACCYSIIACSEFFRSYFARSFDLENHLGQL